MFDTITGKTVDKKLRVAAYGRIMSGGNVMRSGYAELVSHFSGWIQSEEGWSYAGVYVDRDSDHAERDRLLADARGRKIDLVLVPNVSVLRKEALLELTRGLKELNIDMFFESENIHTLSEDGEELISVLASFVKPKPEVPKEKPYGLDDADEAEVVKRIFTMYMEGIARKPIAQILNKEQIPNRRGTPWKDYDIRRITMDPAYRETLIDPETFDAALEKMEQRTKAFHYRNPYEGMFAGIITCGVCGKTYSRRERGVSTLWVCRQYMRKGPAGCDSKSIRERLLKEIITPLLGEKGLEDVDRVDNITVYPDGRLIVTIDDEEIERVWR